MTIDRRLLAGALGCVLLVAACGSSSATASPAPSAAPSTGAGAGASASAAASAAPSDQTPSEPPASSAPGLSLAPGAAPDLEAMLPDTIGTLTFEKKSWDGAQVLLAGSAIDSSKMDPVLKKYGKSVADVRAATDLATPTGAAAMDFAAIVAIQIRGVPAAQFGADIYPKDIVAANKTSIGGKDVYAKTDSGITTAYYLKDDITFLVTASTANVTTLVGELP